MPVRYQPRAYVVPKAPPAPVLHFFVYAYIPPKVGPPPLYALGPGSWEQMTGALASPGGAEPLCQFFWDADKTRTYRVLWNLGQGTPLQSVPGGDRAGWKWFQDLGCYGLGWWANIDWNALAKGPH